MINQGNLKNLEYLSLPNLVYLPDDMGSLIELKSLKLDSFQIIQSKLFKIIKKLPNLRKLEIRNIGNKIPEEIYELDRLEILRLPESGLEEIHEDIGNMTNLKSLVTWGCELTHLPNSLVKLKKLEQLEIASNHPWNKFDGWDIIGKIRNLRYLDISNCRLQNIPSQIFNLKKLEILIIWGNPILPEKIEYLVGDTRDYFPKMERFIFYEELEEEDEICIKEFEEKLMSKI